MDATPPTSAPSLQGRKETPESSTSESSVTTCATNVTAVKPTLQLNQTAPAQAESTAFTKRDTKPVQKTITAEVVLGIDTAVDAITGKRLNTAAEQLFKGNPEILKLKATVAYDLDSRVQLSVDVMENIFNGLKATKAGDAKGTHTHFTQALELIQPASDDSQEIIAQKQALRQNLREPIKCYYDHMAHLFTKEKKMVEKYVVTIGWFYAHFAESEEAILNAAYITIMAAADSRMPFALNIAKATLQLADKVLKNSTGLNPDFRIKAATRIVSHYIKFERFPPILWDIIHREKALALKVPPPSERMQHYWHHYKVLAIAYCKKSLDKGKKTNSEILCKCAFEAIRCGIEHGSQTAYWESGLVKLGLHPVLSDHRLTDPEGKKLYDCFQAEHYFQNYCRTELPFPNAGINHEEILKIEQGLIDGTYDRTDHLLILSLALERLLGGSDLDKDRHKAMALMKLLPDFDSLNRKATQLLRHNDLTASDIRKQQKIETTNTAKILFFAGIEAQKNNKNKLARNYFTASAIGGFCGGVTKLAYLVTNPKQQNELLELAFEMGDISAWRAMGDMLIGSQQLDQARICYNRAITEYLELGFCDEASQAENIIALIWDSTESSSEAKYPKKKPKNRGKLPEKPPSPETGGQDTIKPVSAVHASLPEVKSLETAPHPIPPSTMPAIVVEPSATPTPSHAIITGRFSKWAREIVGTQNTCYGLIGGRLRIEDCKNDLDILLNDATMAPFSRQFKRQVITQNPMREFIYTTWLALRTNMDDDSATLFCSTMNIGRKHAEENMLAYLQPKLEKGDIHSIEILITRNPCDDESRGPGGCWKKILDIVARYPSIQWNIRFITPSGQHRYPKLAVKGDHSQPVLPYNKMADCPADWSHSAQNLTALQEQVQESLKIPNLSYCVVPSYDPDKVADYYGQGGIDKFDKEKFSFNPHFPRRAS